MANMGQSAVQAFPSPLFPHPGLSSSTAAALAPGEVFLILYFEARLCFPSSLGIPLKGWYGQT